MAYDNAWSKVIPAGSVAANLIDDHIRQVRLDLEQRLEDVVEDMTADPIIVNSSVKKTIHWSKGNQYKLTVLADDNWLGFNIGDGFFTLSPGAVSDTLQWIIPLDLPPGVTLTDVVARVYRDSGATVSMAILEHTDTPTKNQIGSTQTSASTGWHDLSQTGLTHVIDEADSYLVQVLLTADGSNATSARLLHLTVEYDRDFALQGL
jgi:hypothetical protein